MFTSVVEYVWSVGFGWVVVECGYGRLPILATDRSLHLARLLIFDHFTTPMAPAANPIQIRHVAAVGIKSDCGLAPNRLQVWLVPPPNFSNIRLRAKFSA
ncbi:hypothetical protein CHU98_g2487 [Xylaria longipes]|nr:hypothetical protein CHU98_g2487 [Xylaria longipes]